MCVLIFSTTFVRNISHSKKKWKTYDQKIYTGIHAKYPLFLLILTGLEFSRQIFRKTLKYQISLKSVQLEPSCSMRTDRMTDMTKLIVAFRNIMKAPKNATEVANQLQACLCLSFCLSVSLYSRESTMHTHWKNSCTRHSQWCDLCYLKRAEGR